MSKQVEGQVEQIESKTLSGSIERRAGCRVIIEAEATPAAVEKAYKDAIKAINKQVSLPGFRKGKAPSEVIVERFEKYVDSQWRDNVIQNAFSDALKAADVMPLNRDAVEKPVVERCSREEGAKLRFELETQPVLPSIDPATLTFEEITPEPVEDEAVESMVHDMLVYHADFEDIEGRVVAAGDYVEVDIFELTEVHEGDEEGEAGDNEKQVATDKRFEINEKKMALWMHKLLVGKNVGDSVEGMSEVDADATDEQKESFVAHKFKITIKTLKKILLPELDDAFAKKVGANTVEDVRVNVRGRLEAEASMHAQDKMKNQALDALATAYDFDLPASLLEAERQERIKGRIRQLKEKGKSDEDIKAQESAIETEVAEETNKALRIYFLTRKIASDENISVTEEDIHHELLKQVWGLPLDQKTLQALTQDSGVTSRLAANILNDKVKAFLVDNRKS